MGYSVNTIQQMQTHFSPLLHFVWTVSNKTETQVTNIYMEAHGQVWKKTKTNNTQTWKHNT